MAMPRSFLSRFMTVMAAAFASVVTSSAQAVYVVDDSGGPGVDYTSLQEAVDVAGPLDRIEVRAGSYGMTVVRGPMTIMGESSVAPTVVSVARLEVRGSAMVPWPNGESLVVADLRADSLFVRDGGTTLLDNLDVEELSLINASDVRLQRSFVHQGADVQSSVLQITSSTLTGNRLGLCDPGIGDGPSAMTVANGSEVTVTGSSLAGAPGQDGSCTSSWAPGGHAILSTQSNLRIIRSDLWGGCHGWTCDCAGFSCGGFFPNGVALSLRCFGSTVITSETTFNSPVLCPRTDIPGLPAMTLEGQGLPTTTVDFSVFALGGSNTRLWVGRRSALVPIAGLAVPRMHSFDRGLALGSMAPSGVISIPFVVPALNRGTLIFAQSSRTLTAGPTELSNPVTLIVR